MNKVSFEDKFLEAIKHHLQGWKEKIETDFSEKNYNKELSSLKDDPVYSKFGFDCPEYVLVRLVGRMSISIGRRLGEIYDKLPRFAAVSRFGITHAQVTEKFEGLELDIAIRYEYLSDEDKNHITEVIKSLGGNSEDYQGIGIEIRYNFNPNDSARLRKDVSMVGHLKAAKLFPVYLIYSSISPREDAIGRLTRAGWIFAQGEDASEFTNTLFSFDFLNLMETERIRTEIQKEVKSILGDMFKSFAFSKVET